MSAPNSKPVHPCFLSVFEGKTGVEYSIFAHVTENSLDDGRGGKGMPDLITAHASSLSIYRVEESTGKLLLVHTYSNLAGNVCFLETLRVDDVIDDDENNNDDGQQENDINNRQHTNNPTIKRRRSRIKGRKRRPDSLLIGFCGHPRLAIVHVQPGLLLATTLLDLTPALTENSYGAVTPLEQDLTASLFQKDTQHQATVSVVLGGGISLVCLQLEYNTAVGGWRAVEEPYLLPLSTLARTIDKKEMLGAGSGGGHQNHSSNQHRNHRNNNKDTNSLLPPSIVTGFGDILSTAFLPGYLEPTLVILHSNPYVGHAWSGRWGRESGGTRYSLVLTAVTVTVGHQRSALLWSTEVPADAIYVYTCPLNSSNRNHKSMTAATTKKRDGNGSSSMAACLVHCVNSVVWISNTGQIQQCLAVNGWAESALSVAYSGFVTGNPWPFPKQSIQLDGAQFTAVNATTWFVVLRRGQVYLLQNNTNDCNQTDVIGEWSFMSLYQTVGAVGEVSHVSYCPMGKYNTALLGESDKMWGKNSLMFSSPATSKVVTTTKILQSMVDMGLIFVASRMGDSSLLGYALGKTSLVNALKTEPGLGNVKKENTTVPNKVEELSTKDQKKSLMVDDSYERILQVEEEALYAPLFNEINTTTYRDESLETLNVIPPSDDEDNEEQYPERKRARFSNLSVVRSLHVLDSLTSLGPLGPACSGPLAPSPEHVIDPTVSTKKVITPVGTTGYVFPCGFGSSGGIALLSVPGRDDRTILAEADCINAKALFSLPRRNLILLTMLPENGGTKVFKLEGEPASLSVESIVKKEATELNLIEIDLDEWCPNEDAREFFTTCHVLISSDLTDDSFLVLAASPIDENSESYFIVVFQDGKDTISMKAASQLDILQGEFITTVKAVEDQESEQVFLAYTLNTGESKVIIISSDGSVNMKNTFSIDTQMDITDYGDEEDEILSEEENFYSDRNIVSVDIFKAPKSFFIPQSIDNSWNETSGIAMNDDTTEIEVDLLLDEDDKELYYDINKNLSDGTKEAEENTSNDDVRCNDFQIPDEGDVWYLAISRQSGELDIFLFSNLNDPVWSCVGCGHGVPSLESQKQTPFRNPIGHKVCTQEMRFFFCGPSSSEWGKSFTGPRPFCLMLETSDGDAQIYVADIHHRSLKLQSFRRVPLKDVSRPSQESTKHFSKLRRKKIISAKDGTEKPNDFRHNRLFSFHNISGQDGAFASVSRPFWLIAERGKPAILHHRCRHVAPAGAKSRPIAGFCSGLSIGNGNDSSFVTVHERVGRVGSQRMTLFDGILNLASKNSLMPGGGLFAEKIPFGVTVRKIQFIDDGHHSTGTHPLYAVLVSREYEGDLSELNEDGLSDEERQHIADDKENAKIQRQVEADLGGFDVEQEWVEEIERENCFKIDKVLGGAPPIPKSAYSLWIVDVANGWQVVDSYELDEFEYGTAMQVMSLSEFVAEPGSNYDISEEDLDSKLFITVGAGTIDKDGEDVASKGRVLLFEVKRAKDPSSLSIAELNFVYEKKIFHGPVTSLSCLTTKRKSRLIIGAGADVNVEQWGNGKLTQVGFFRATMHILDIKLFKNFLILSDAYDSLFFLVWRESDKSLTLLAKDYDPIPVYCSGILSRGGSLDFVCHDDRQNLQFFQYAPGDPAARGGNKLVCRADFHLGSQTTDLSNHFCRSSLLINSATPSSTLAALKQQDTFFGKADDDQRLAITFGTTDGGYCSVVPLSEPVYWRLTALQSVLVNALESDCALSHRAWRLYRRTPRRGGCRNNDRKKGVIDGDLVMQYTDLSKVDQEDLASAIGSTVDLILDNLLELRCSTMVL